jgi:hypothetical protein
MASNSKDYEQRTRQEQEQEQAGTGKWAAGCYFSPRNTAQWERGVGGLYNISIEENQAFYFVYML